MLKITNTLLKGEAESRGWRVDVIDEENGVLRYHLPNGKSLIMQSSLTPLIPAVGLRLADNKLAIYRLAEEAGVRIPATLDCSETDKLPAFIEQYKRIVIKPLDSSHGNGVTVNVSTLEEAQKAIKTAEEFSMRVLAQEQVTGDDYRLLFIDYKLEAAAIRQPASVTGDGTHSVLELINAENQSPDRAKDYKAKRNIIDVEAAKRFLGEQVNEVPAADEERVVVGTANIGTGGEAIDVTDKVPSNIVESAIRLLKSLEIPMAGVDFMGTGDDFWLLEINATPSFGLHVFPSEGTPRQLHKIFLDWIERSYA